MKKLYFVYWLLFVSMCANAKVYVTLNAHYDNEADDFTPHHRVPIAPLRIEQENHLFVFNTCFSGNAIEIYEDDVLIYTSYISENGSVEIPSDICGEVEICLLRGNRIYSAMVEL